MYVRRCRHSHKKNKNKTGQSIRRTMYVRNFPQYLMTIGHSFLRRLLTINKEENFLLDRAKTTVNCVTHAPGDRSAKFNLIKDVYRVTAEMVVKHGFPEVMCFMLGSNDIVERYNEPVTKILADLMMLGNKWIEIGTRRVVFVEVLPRLGRFAYGRHQPRSLPMDKQEEVFDERRKTFNKYLQSWIRAHDEMDYLELNGLHEDITQRLYDGLHLDRVGRHKLRKAMKKRLVFNLDKAKEKREYEYIFI